MAMEIVAGTPLADALQKDVEQKFVELEWSSEGLDAASLAEYVVLMLGNAKSQQEIAQELSQDLLQLDPSDGRPVQFAQWLFQRAEQLSRGETSAPVTSQHNGDSVQATNENGMNSEQMDEMDDADMGEGGSGPSIPTGPKSMRGGPGQGQQKTRDRRMLGQLNRALDRSSGPDLHRIRGAANGRINSHSSNPPKGPRAQQHAQNRQTAVNNMVNPMAGLNPQQQMQMMQMFEHQAQLMAQVLSPQQQQQFFGNQLAMNGSNGRGGMQNGRPLSERIQRPRRGGGKFQHRSQNGSEAMETDATELTGDGMDVEGGTRDPAKTVCKFNLKCTKADCPFAHQSPAAPAGTPVDMEDECQFGAACMNQKCTGRHPSPGQRTAHKSEELCKFFPNCMNRACPFKHPDMPYCRNGADCTDEGCKYTHSTVACKYNPCLNPKCPYKHVEGQKQKIQNKVWINPENEDGDVDKKEHISDRKFIDEEAGEEELIRPQGAPAAQEQAATEGVVT